MLLTSSRSLAALAALLVATTAGGVPGVTLVAAAEDAATTTTVHGLGAPCFEACLMVLRPVVFADGADEPNPRRRLCTSTQSLTSLYLCGDYYCNLGERTAGLDLWNTTCRDKYQVTIPSYGSLTANYTDEDVEKLYRFERYAPRTDAVKLDDVALPSERIFLLAFNTMVGILEPPAQEFIVPLETANTIQRLLGLPHGHIISIMGRRILLKNTVTFEDNLTDLEH